MAKQKSRTTDENLTLYSQVLMLLTLVILYALTFYDAITSIVFVIGILIGLWFGAVTFFRPSSLAARLMQLVVGEKNILSKGVLHEAKQKRKINNEKRKYAVKYSR